MEWTNLPAIPRPLPPGCTSPHWTLRQLPPASSARSPAVFYHRLKWCGKTKRGFRVDWGEGESIVGVDSGREADAGVRGRVDRLQLATSGYTSWVSGWFEYFR